MATPKEKKQIAVIAVMLLATFVVIYFNFLKPKPKPAAITTALPGSLPAGAPGSALPIIAGAGGAAITTGTAASSPNSTFLPGGTNLNLNVLDDKHFKALVPPVYPVVTPDEIGSTDVFNNSSSSSTPTQPQK